MAVTEFTPTSEALELDIARYRLGGAIGVISVAGYEALLPDYFNALQREHFDGAAYLTRHDVAKVVCRELDELQDIGPYGQRVAADIDEVAEQLGGRIGADVPEDGDQTRVLAHAFTLTMFDFMEELRPESSCISVKKV